MSSDVAERSSAEEASFPGSGALSLSASSQRGSPPDERRGTLVDGGAVNGGAWMPRGADSLTSG